MTFLNIFVRIRKLIHPHRRLLAAQWIIQLKVSLHVRTWSFASYMQGFLDCSVCSLLGERVKSSAEIHRILWSIVVQNPCIKENFGFMLSKTQIMSGGFSDRLCNLVYAYSQPQHDKKICSYRENSRGHKWTEWSRVHLWGMILMFLFLLYSCNSSCSCVNILVQYNRQCSALSLFQSWFTKLVEKSSIFWIRLA